MTIFFFYKHRYTYLAYSINFSLYLVGSVWPRVGLNPFGKISLSFKHLPNIIPQIINPLLPLALRSQSFPKSAFCVLLWVTLHSSVWKGYLVLFLQCQLAVIPLGTGNDLARVLGWGAFWNKNKSPLDILNRVEQASVRILDRWVAERSGYCAFSSCTLVISLHHFNQECFYLPHRAFMSSVWEVEGLAIRKLWPTMYPSNITEALHQLKIS